jgi:FKBP-type peptidyl-prolyl cis-trans isomerase 2
MRTAQMGDRVQVRYVKRWQDGSVISSRVPLELTIGDNSRRLPGLGLNLVGLAPGNRTTLSVPAEQAYGASDPDRIYRLRRKRFKEGEALEVGRWMRIPDRKGRRRLVRILEVSEKAVVVDNNHRHAGQTLKLEVELIAIHGADSEAARPPS